MINFYNKKSTEIGLNNSRPYTSSEMINFSAEQDRTRGLFRGVLRVRRGIKPRGEHRSAGKGPFPETN